MGKRSSLFHEAIRIIRDAMPDYFIFENVKGLFSSNEGRDWFTVLREIADSGYDGQWQLLNTRWVLPQNRERIYFVGYIRGKPGPEIFPIGEDNPIFNQSRQKTQGEGKRLYSPSINAGYGKVRGGGELFIKDNRINKINIINNKQIRRLTPKECERLQGFKDGWTEGVSDTQRYKCLGNAVTVPIVKLVAEKLLSAIQKELL